MILAIGWPIACNSSRTSVVGLIDHAGMQTTIAERVAVRANKLKHLLYGSKA
jgi:hypothetical protein